jgi:hypothetical protein
VNEAPSWQDFATESWRRGDLQYKLHNGQEQLQKAARASTETEVVLHAARGYGKTWWRLVDHTEQCLTHRKQRHVYAAPTREQAKQIVIPTMQMIVDDAPAKLKPVWQSSEHRWFFPSTESVLIVDGADDDRGDHLRGPFAHRITFDEAAFSRHCKYVLRSVLLPQAQRVGGQIVVCSTSPESVGHDFVSICGDAIRKSSYFKFTIMDNPRLTREQIDRVVLEVSGCQTLNEAWRSTFVRREFLCEFVTDSTRAVIPEFSDACVVQSYELPQFCDKYAGLDLGLVDMTHCLLGHYNFSDAQLVIEDEVCVNYTRTSDVAEMIKAKERQLWGDVPVTGRYSDNEAQQLYDLRGFGLPFTPALKTDKEAAINRLRLMFSQNKIRIHERCKNLIHQLRVGVWNDRRTDYERLPGAGHLDGLDALVYMARSINYNRNPVPEHLGVSRFTHHAPPRRSETHALQKLGRR